VQCRQQCNYRHVGNGRRPTRFPTHYPTVSPSPTDRPTPVPICPATLRTVHGSGSLYALVEDKMNWGDAVLAATWWDA
jgi:hypothetical protein